MGELHGPAHGRQRGQVSGQRFPRRKAAIRLDQIVPHTALHQLHRQQRLSRLVAAHVVHGHDVGMVESGGDESLAAEHPFGDGGVGWERRRRGSRRLTVRPNIFAGVVAGLFHGHDPVEPDLHGVPDLSTSPPAHGPAELVGLVPAGDV